MEANIDFAKGRAPFLNIAAKTWYRDSHGLFDYDSQNVVRSKLTRSQQNLNIITRQHETFPIVILI